MKYMFKILTAFLIIAALSCSGGHREEPGGYVIPEFYHSPEEINEFLDEMYALNSAITRIETIGRSVSGREIKAIIISGDPVEPGTKPRIRLTGGIHGSEIISAELMVYFIRYLVENYDTDSDIKSLVDSRYIAVIPVLNPDGLAVAGRRNDNGVDLNRNFSSTWVSGYGYGTGPFSEPESQALRDFSIGENGENFHLSLTFHSGAVLVNIPFDYVSEIEDGIVPAENNLVREFAFAYSMAGTFLDNPDLFDPLRLENGIINGGNWYVISGSLQDWSYLETGCLDLTVEVAKRSPMTIEGVEQVFNYNRDSIIAYIKKGGQGVYGRVTHAGAGVTGVEIKLTHVAGLLSAGDIIVRTDAEGYYHRILLPGNYTLSFEKTGYTAESINVTVPDSDYGILENIELTP